MNNKINFHKKDKGEIGNDTLEFMVAIVFFFFFISSLIVIQKQLRNYEKINAIARDYILRIETEGYLTPEMEQNLELALSTTTLTDVSLEGTSETPLENGDTGYLVISGKLSNIKIKITKRIVVQN